VLGRTLLHYRILEKIGQGGMGVVYKAHDTKLDRLVALKFLPHELERSGAEVARFLQEARAASAINHPNVCVIHDIHEAEGETFIVMEYVEGVTLSARLVGGALPLRKAIDYAIQIAEALKEAHRRAIVHRDIKADNVMVNERDQIKVMDFGLAKLKGSVKLTATGSTVGTLAYMAPEQIRGGEVDARSDLFSFGVLLYELVAGRLPFASRDPAELMYRILSEDAAPLATHRPEAPPELQHLISRALEKDPEDRYQSAAEMVIELRRLKRDSDRVSRKPLAEVAGVSGAALSAAAHPAGARAADETGAGDAVPVSPPGARERRRVIPLVVVAALSLAGVASVLVTRGWRQTAKPGPPVNHRQLTFVGDAAYPGVSPEGQFLAYVTGPSRDQKVIVQDLVSGRALEVFRGQGLSDLRWSPDGANIRVFSQQGPVVGGYLVPRLGGTARRLPSGYRGAWSPDGTQIASIDQGTQRLTFTNIDTGVMRFIPLTGPLTFLMDVDWSRAGDWLLFVALDKSNQASLWVIKPDGTEQQKLHEQPSSRLSARWGPTDEAIYYLSGDQTQELWKVRVSVKSGKTDGPPVLLLAGLESGSSFQVLRDGKRLLHTRSSSYSNLWLATVEGTGSQGVQIRQLTSGTLMHDGPRFSPDGSRIGFSRGDAQTSNIFLLPAEGGSPQQVTFMRSLNRGPVWSPDGRSIAFGSNEGGATRVWQSPADGGTPQPLAGTSLSPNTFSLEWAPGRNILYQRPGNRNFSMVNPVTATESPLLEVDSIGWIFAPRYSPDGKRLVAFWNRPPTPGLYVLSVEGSRADPKQSRLVTGSLTFGPITQGVEAAPFRGKEVKLTAHVKAQVRGKGNTGRCWLRVDRPKGQMGFFDNMADRPIHTASWNEYAISGMVDADADRIVFGCLLEGAGELWVDELQLSFRDESGTWIPIEINNPGFEEDDDGQRPAGWSASMPGYTYRATSENPYSGKRSLIISAVRLPKDRFFAIGWSSDGKYIYAIDESWNIVAIQPGGGDARTIMTLPVRENQAIAGTSITPDGRRVVFAVLERRSDVWIIDNFDRPAP
jgi:Tol biopolymer transport system component/predicted Ser/Thr protein kinase